MCGIAGCVQGEIPVVREILGRMLKKIRHRGPDAEGIFVEDGVGLAHARLAVIDLDRAANQPMRDDSGRFVIVYNGEIYNFKDVRFELEKRGVRFRTNSDTEVVLAAYSAWGPQSVTRFNGMFAYAIWDRSERTLFLARDRLGKKPLYYFRASDGAFVFASELKALRVHSAVPTSIDPAALAQYLVLNYVPSPTCVLKDVHKFPAASYALLREGEEPKAVEYWSLKRAFRNKVHYRNSGEAAEALNSLLDDAVRLRMVSDVPLGAFLSGGIDSSAIAASMSLQQSGENVHTFSMGFGEKGYSEVAWSEEVANQLGVSHRSDTLTAEVSAELDKVVYFGDEPFADTSLLPMYVLARFARKHVTVVLSGDGSDEIFAGYETYVADRLQHFANKMPRIVTRFASEIVDRFLPVTWNKVSFDYKLRQFLKGANLDPNQAHCIWRAIFDPDRYSEVFSKDYREQLPDVNPFDYFYKQFDEISECHYLDKAMYVDIKTWLLDDILVKVDRATMAHALEARSPFLDHRLVEFAAGLPVNLKLRGLNKKYILKQSQTGRLPKKILQRPKRGFNAPVSYWITTSLKPLLLDVCNSLRFQGVFDRVKIETMLLEHTDKRVDHHLRLYGLLCLGLWMEQNQV